MKLPNIGKLGARRTAADPAQAFGARDDAFEAVLRESYTRPQAPNTPADLPNDPAAVAPDGWQNPFADAAPANADPAGYAPPRQSYTPPRQSYEPPRQSYEPPRQSYTPPQYAPDPHSGQYADPYAPTGYAPPQYAPDPHAGQYADPYAPTGYAPPYYAGYAQPNSYPPNYQAAYAQPPYAQQPGYAPYAAPYGAYDPYAGAYAPPSRGFVPKKRERKKMSPEELRYTLWSGSIVLGIVGTVVAFVYACCL